MLNLTVRDAEIGNKLVVTVGTDQTSEAATILYAIDSLEDPIDWVTGPDIDAPAAVEVSGLNDGVWYVIQVVPSGLGMPSNLDKACPTDGSKYYDLWLVKEAITSYVVGRCMAFRMRVSAIRPQHMTKYVFLHRREAFTSMGDNERDVFVAIAKPGDLEAYPIDEPLVDVDPPFFRKCCVDLVEDNMELLREDFEALKSDALELTLALENNRYLSREVRINVGADTICPEDEPEPSSSSDSSDSSSENPGA